MHSYLFALHMACIYNWDYNYIYIYMFMRNPLTDMISKMTQEYLKLFKNKYWSYSNIYTLLFSSNYH